MTDPPEASEPSSVLAGAGAAGRRKLVLRSVAQLGLGVLLFGGLLWWVAPPWSEIRGLVSLSLGLLSVSFVGAACANAVTAARWKMLSEAMGATRLPYGVYFHWLAMTRLLGQILPTVLVDVIGRGAALKMAGSQTALGRLIAPVVLERILDLLLPLCMLAWALGVWGGWLGGIDPWASLGGLVLVFAILAVPLLSPMAAIALRLYVWLKSVRQRRRARKAKADAAATAVMDPAGAGADADPATDAATDAADGDAGAASTSSGESLPRVSVAMSARIVGLSIARYASILVQYWGAGAGFGVMLPALVLASAAPLAQLAGLIGITPGGLGVQEGGWVAALDQLGQPQAAIVVYMSATRLMMVVNFGLLSAVSWPWRVAKNDHHRRKKA